MLDIENTEIIVDPPKTELEIFWNGLRTFNSQFIKDDNFNFAAVIKNKEGKIIAGINGSSYWGKMHVNNLWVDENYRKLGLGKKLMNFVEKKAIKENCNGIQLDTFSFQAEEFYIKLGFKEFGRINNYNNDFTRIYMHKDLI